MNRVVPVAVEPMAFEAHARQLRIGHRNTGRVVPAIELGTDVQAGLAVAGLLLGWAVARRRLQARRTAM